MDNDIQELRDFLGQMLNGSLPANEAEVRMKTCPAFRRTELEGVYANLFHYISDVDIREKDAGYGELQDSEMKKLISRLEAGDFAGASAVTLLRST